MTPRAPFPYFGGKSRIAELVWSLMGADMHNYVEPFAGSLAVLLARPHPQRGPETANDLDCHIINAWRSIAAEPDALAHMLVGPVSEADAEARHLALVRGIPALRDLMADPHAHDIERAAWWVKGACECIGDGWCSGDGPWSWSPETGWQKSAGPGINRQLPSIGDAGSGINRRPPASCGAGEGVHARRVAWIAGWLRALRDRLCSARLTCGSWERVLGYSVLDSHGLTGVFLDPPYAGTEHVYGSATLPVSLQVNAWCAENGPNPLLRIVLAGRAAEHDNLIPLGWTRSAWSGAVGYSKTADRHGEALWASPACRRPGGQAVMDFG